MGVRIIQFIKTWTSLVWKPVKHGRPICECLDVQLFKPKMWTIERWKNGTMDGSILFFTQKVINYATYSSLSTSTHRRAVTVPRHGEFAKWSWLIWISMFYLMVFSVLLFRRRPGFRGKTCWHRHQLSCLQTITTFNWTHLKKNVLPSPVNNRSYRLLDASLTTP